MVNKKGAIGFGWILAIIGVLLVASGTINLQNIFGTIPGQPAPPTPPGQPLCPSSAETLTFKGFEKYTTTAIPSGEVWVNGVDQGNRTDGSTLSVGIDTDVAVLYGYQDNKYFGDFATFKMPCRAVSTAETSLSKGAHELIRIDTNASTNGRWVFFNSDDGNANSAAENNSIGTASAGSWNMELQFQNKRAFNPERIATTLPNGQAVNPKILFVVEYNTTTYEASEIKWSENYPVVANPTFHTIRFTGNNLKTFELPACSRTQETCLIKGTLNVKAKSGQDPAATGAVGEILNVTLIPQDFDLKTTGNTLDDIIFGHQDDVGNPVDRKFIQSILLYVA